MLRSLGVGKGDRVLIYMPMIPGGGVRDARLRAASARSIRWCSAASPRHSLAARIDDAQPKLMITADAGMRGGQARSLQAAGRRGDPAVEITAGEGADRVNRGLDTAMHADAPGAISTTPALRAQHMDDAGAR